MASPIGGYALETIVEVVEVVDGKARCRTDHTGCDDLGQFSLDRVTFDKYWAPSRTATFDGYVNRQVGTCPKCHRKYKMRIPRVRYVEARLR